MVVSVPEMEDSQRRVILADIAREVGVSTATVSYVLNDAPGHSISAETQQRVLSVASKLGYKRSGVQGFRRGRCDVAVLDASTFSPGAALSSAIGAFDRSLREGGMMAIVRRGQPTEPGLPELVDAVAPVAVISMCHTTADAMVSLTAARVPHVSAYNFGSFNGGKGWDHALGEQQVLHLAARGHRCIAYAHTSDQRLRAVSRLRAAGAREAGEAFDLAGFVEFVSPEDDVSRLHLLARLRASHPRLSAVAAYDDEVAMALISTIHRMGLTVPDGMAVIGADELPLARLTVPALTTLGVDAGAVGERMAQNLLRERRGERRAFGDVEPEIRVVSRASA